MGKMHGKSRETKLLENCKCFQILPSLCSSKIECNCIFVNTNTNLQLAYYILEFQQNLFSRASRAQRRI